MKIYNKLFTPPLSILPSKALFYNGDYQFNLHNDCMWYAGDNT